MVIDISIRDTFIFVAQTVSWVSLSLLLWFFMYFGDDVYQMHETKIKNSIYAALVVVLFLLIYGIVEINWLP